MYVMLKDGNPSEWPVNHDRVRHENPNVSFPTNMKDVNLSLYGFYPFRLADAASHDPKFQKAVEIQPVLSDGTYVQTWQIDELYTTEQKATKQAEIEAERLVSLAATERAKRDELLAETDYLALSDTTLSSAMTTYRQQLREVPQQAEFPNTISWPTKP